MWPLSLLRVWTPAAFRARRAYFAAQDRAGVLIDEFGSDRAADAFTRSEILFDLSDLERTMAAHQHGFPGSGHRDRDGFTLADSNEHAAVLLGLVGASEYCLHNDQVQTAMPVMVGLSARASAVVDALCAETDLGTRGALVLDLYHATVAQFGGQAAEALAAVAVAYFQLSGMTRDDARRRVWTVLGGEW